MPNKENALKSGMFAEVKFTKDSKENAITLPISSIISEDGDSYVYIVDDGIAKKVKVTLGIDIGTSVEILEGIDENMSIIVKGQSYIKDGETVTDVTEQSEKPDSDVSVEEPGLEG